MCIGIQSYTHLELKHQVVQKHQYFEGLSILTDIPSPLSLYLIQFSFNGNV
jgi:hypothetical protein